MAKPRITKGVQGKKIVELEAVASTKYDYFIRLDGACFREFRVQKRSYEELKIFDGIMRQLCKDILARYKFVRFIFYHDDEINILFKGKELHMKRRIQKNLSLITSFVSVRFNTLLRKSDLYKIVSVNREYYFDARFVEMKNQTAIKDYIKERMDGVRFQVVNLLRNVLGIKNTKFSINNLIKKHFMKNERLEKYKSIFGYYVSRVNEDEITDNFNEFVVKIQSVAQESIKD
jgi:tRNA(His) 5'-end guanylyltransferase